MKKILLAIVMLTVILSSACAAGQVSTLPSPADDGTAPGAMPARPGSGATGDPSANLDQLTDVAGTVKEVKEGLVLIDLDGNGGEFMLRLSDNTQWAEGVEKEFKAGNRVECLVKPEPTVTTPSQGEVYRVVSNQPGK